jgi:hypothetical protein
MIEAIVGRVAGLDVHKMVIVATVLLEQADGQIWQETHTFSSFRRDREALCRWLQEGAVEVGSMRFPVETPRCSGLGFKLKAVPPRYPATDGETVR